MTEADDATQGPSWIDRMLDRDLPAHIRRIREQLESAVTPSWLRTELHGTVLSFLGDVAAYARDLGNWIGDHEDRLQEVEAFVEALGQETQLVPSDADDVAKLAGGTKLLVTAQLKDGSQDESGKALLAELLVIAERVEKMVATARLDADPIEDGADEEIADTN